GEHHQDRRQVGQYDPSCVSQNTHTSLHGQLCAMGQSLPIPTCSTIRNCAEMEQMYERSRPGETILPWTGYKPFPTPNHHRVPCARGIAPGGSAHLLSLSNSCGSDLARSLMG